MSRKKTKRQKIQAAQRKIEVTREPEIVLDTPKREKNIRQHAISEYEQKLREYTVKDTITTFFIIVAIFALQAGIFYIYFK